MLTVQDIVRQTGLSTPRVHQIRARLGVGRQEPTGRRRWLFTPAEAAKIANRLPWGRPRQSGTRSQA